MHDNMGPKGVFMRANAVLLTRKTVCSGVHHNKLDDKRIADENYL